MAEATFVRSSFVGGEWSKHAQGRYDKPEYVTALNVCLNAFPIETGAWVRRPGTMEAGLTRGGAVGRLIKFDFEADAPYNMEFTDGHLRFWNGPRLAITDSAFILGVSTANPAVVHTGEAKPWLTGDQVYFAALGTNAPLLQNRVFKLTKIDTEHFSLADAITGDSIDGATLNYVVKIGATINRVLDLVTPYSAGIWSTLRSVQTEKTSFLLNRSVPPYALQVTTAPTVGNFATFSLGPAVFNDGPYLDPFVNGVQANPSAKLGVITITLTFPAYDAAVAYAKGAFVTSASINYESLVDQNVGNTPVGSPTKWQAVDAGQAISPNGFQGSDVGRLVRLFSEPQLWAVGTTYAVGNVVAFNPSGLPGQTTYWTSLIGSNTGKQPGLDLVSWTLTPQGAAIWSWGKIVSLSNIISGSLAGSVQIGDMTAFGGLAAAFDGTPTKGAAASASKTTNFSGDCTGYAGKNYSGASAQAIGGVTIYPSSDFGFTYFDGFGDRGTITVFNPNVTLNLRANANLPSSASDGTLLGTTGLIADTVSPVSISSADIATTWNYVWIEIVGEHQAYPFPRNYELFISQIEFFAPAGTGVTGNGVNIEILGPPLLYTTPIRTWRLGVYSNTTGWPAVGTYHEGRLWLFGANKVYSSVSNGITGAAVNFAPTDQYGTVSAASAISYVFNAPDANPIFWAMPDLKGIICGTQGGEWLLHPPTPGSMSPFNIAAQRNTNVRCANIEPRRTEHTTIFVQAFRRKVLEYFDDIYSGKFTGPTLQENAKHLTASGLDEIVYQQELAPLIWTRVAGRLVGATYKRDTPAAAQKPSILGWHSHALGSSNPVVSICVGPSASGDIDSLAMVTQDVTAGLYHVEVLTDILGEDAALADAWFLDSAVRPSSRVSNLAAVAGAPLGGMTLNGLWHLNGRTVSVFAGGLDCGDPGEGKPIVDFLVANGSVFVPYGDSISAGSGRGLFTESFAAAAPIVVGFTYTSDGQIVRPNAPAESGARIGPAFAKTRREEMYGIQVENTRGLSIGTRFTKLRPIPFKSESGRAMTPLQTFTGIYRDTLEDDYSFDSMLCWRQTRPFPANVIAIGGFISTQDV